jgi:acyl-CoA synthetase (AMP-forming)/AMP-acid ligase II
MAIRGDAKRFEPHSDTLVTCLRARFETFGDTRSYTHLYESGRALAEDVTTFGDLDRGAREVAAWLSSRPEARRPVLLLFEPGVQFWRAFLGCLYAGVVAIPAPLPHDQRGMNRLAGILRDADSSLALTTTKLLDLLVGGIEGLGLQRPIRCVATDGAPLADADPWAMPHITPDAVAFLQYTSGSSGDPKGVAVTHANVMSNAATISEAVHVTRESVVFGWIPHFHDMGLIGGLVAFFVGANLVMMSPLAFLKQPVRLLNAAHDYRGTHCAAPNFAYDLIARRVTPEQLAGLDLSTWQVALNGAEPVRRGTIERINDLLAPAGFSPTAMRPGYGMAEATLMATVSCSVVRYLDADADALEQNRYAPAKGRSVSLVSSGQRGRGVGVHIVDPETLRELPDGRVG